MNRAGGEGGRKGRKMRGEGREGGRDVVKLFDKVKASAPPPKPRGKID